MELLILLVQRQGELVSREEIAGRLWRKDVFVDIDHSINTAVRKIRLVLRDDPEKPRFVETVVGKGYRFAAPVTHNNGSSETTLFAKKPLSSHGIAEPAVPVAQKKRLSTRLILLLGVAALAVIVIILLVTNRSGAKVTSSSAIKSLAVLPLKNLSGDPKQEYLADGMTEAVIGRLAGIHDLRVISRTSVVRFKDTQLRSLPHRRKRPLERRGSICMVRNFHRLHLPRCTPPIPHRRRKLPWYFHSLSLVQPCWRGLP